MRFTKTCSALIVGLGLLAVAAPSNAAPVVWDVNPTQSFLRLNINDQNATFDGIDVTVRLRNADNSTWNDNGGKRAFLDGTITTDYADGVSIDFTGGAHNLFALESGSFRPNPAAFNPAVTDADNPDGTYTNTSGAAAAFAARVQISAFGLVNRTLGYLAVRDAFLDLDSGVIALGGGTSIAASATSLGIESALADIDGLFMAPVPIIGTEIGQVVPDTLGAEISLPANGVNSSGGSVIALGPPGSLERQLTLTINMPLTFDLEGVLLTASITGQIVATTTLVPIPEPSSLVLAGFAAFGLAFAGRRRFRRS